MSDFTGTESTRFWGKVAKADGCWLWLGTKGSDGYGIFKLRGRNVRAHRVVLGMRDGTLPPSRFVVCHRCDVPLCVNPDHLFLGTPADNSADMRAKGRQPTGMKPEESISRGERHGMAKLTDAEARDLLSRLRAGQSLGCVAERFGVTKSQACAIKNGRSRRHLQCV